MRQNIVKSFIYGFLASAILLTVYFAVLTLVSDWSFALNQFSGFWYFIVSLAVGFGVQVGLYIYLRNVIHASKSSGKVLAVSGATSTGAMISCCAHYLVNILPIIGVTGFVSIVSQYQIELFWVGIIFNLAGIIYVARKIVLFRSQT